MHRIGRRKIERRSWVGKVKDVSRVEFHAEPGDAGLESAGSLADALAAVVAAGPSTPVLIDFDETLLLCNSTEEYIDSARPKVLGLLMLSALGLLKPWALAPDSARGHVRDWLRVVVVTLLIPWTPLVWRFRAPRLTVDETNAPLRDALNASQAESIVITTLGFRFIVAPVLERMDVRYDALVASRFWGGARDRMAGKRSHVESRLGPHIVERSVVITDSESDRDLLDAARHRYLVVWPGARYRRGLEGTYVPFVYLDRVKHPNRSFFLKTVLADDWMLAVLAASWIATNQVGSAAAILLLSLAFWTIYEVGYMENDRVAATSESDPFLHEEFHSYDTRFRWWTPWLWAIALTTAGTYVAHSSGAARAGLSAAALAALWLALLAVTRTVFAIFNRLDKLTRVWVYPILQVARSFGILLMVPVTIVGSIALAAQVASRWATYMIYRYGHTPWPSPGVTQLMRLILFAVLIAAVAIGGGLELVAGWQAAAIAGWFAIRATRGLLEVLRSA